MRFDNFDDEDETTAVDVIAYMPHDDEPRRPAKPLKLRAKTQPFGSVDVRVIVSVWSPEPKDES